MVKATYRGIPCFYDVNSYELDGRNWFYGIILDIVLWIDIYIIEVEEFKVKIKDEK